MNPVEMVVLTKSEFELLLDRVMDKKLQKFFDDKPILYSRNQIAQKLQMGNRKVQQLIDEGKLVTTSNGKITQQAFDNFLNGIKQSQF